MDIYADLLKEKLLKNGAVNPVFLLSRVNIDNMKRKVISFIIKDSELSSQYVGRLSTGDKVEFRVCLMQLCDASNMTVSKLAHELNQLLGMIDYCYQNKIDSSFHNKEFEEFIYAILVNSGINRNEVYVTFGVFALITASISFIDGVPIFIRHILDDNQSGNEYETFYRGHDVFGWDLIPSLYRDASIFNENRLYFETIRKSPSEFQKNETTLEHLAKLQHYGIPTRLLDLTQNPLVALYFACCSCDSSNNAEVISFKQPSDSVKFYDSDTVSMISNICKMNRDFSITANNIKSFNRTNDAKKLLHKIKEDKPYFEPIMDPNDLRKTLFVLPKSDTPRITQQSGAFLICGIGETILEPSKQLDDIVKECSLRMIITGSSKKRILQELKQLNISSSTIFPELSEMSKEIHNKFNKV